jgi:phosphatidate cytidylyltransferase
MSKNLRHRLIVSFIALLILLIFIYLAPHPFFKPFFASFIAASIAAALWEYYQITKIKGHRPLTKIGITTSIAYTLAIFINTQYANAVLIPAFVLAIAFVICFLYFFMRESKPLDSLSVTLFGIAYLTIPLSCAVSIVYFFHDRSPQDGRWWLLYGLIVTKMTDTGAYFVGKLAGKHQLAAYISPKKTIEGAIGGVLFAVATSILIPHLASFLSSPYSLPLSLFQEVYLGIMIGILAQIGDLGESLLKRDAGIKDSNQLPGLGGMLDIVDSLIFTIPMLYFFLHFQNG